MQANPDDQTNFCFTSTKATNLDLIKLFEIGEYMYGGFNTTNFAS